MKDLLPSDEAPPRLPEWLARKLAARRAPPDVDTPNRGATTVDAPTSVNALVSDRTTTDERDVFARVTAEEVGANAGRTMEMSTLTLPVRTAAEPPPSTTARLAAIGFRRMLVGAAGPIVFHTSAGLDVLPACAPARAPRCAPPRYARAPARRENAPTHRAPFEAVAAQARAAPDRPRPTRPTDALSRSARNVGLSLLPWGVAVAVFACVAAVKLLEDRGLETNLRGAFHAFATSLVVRARP